jgi:BirA family biotin operon repressor/biotin-[acetyl-CoA-carboxylase] ligase
MDGAGFRGFLDQLGAAAGHSGGGAPHGPINRVVASRVDSTNRLARRVVATYAAEEMPPPDFLVFAFEQTAGRGRQGRTWASPRGCGVYATRVLPLPERLAEADALQSLPLLAGVGLARALAGLLERGGARGRAALKWPNDLLIEGRKAGGVLAEALALGSGPPVALIGFGLNHLRPREGPELPPGATCLADHLAAPPPLGRVARALAAGLEAELAHLGDLPRATAAYRELAVHRPGDRLRCRVGGEVIEGALEGFDDRGHLVLRQGGDRVRIAAGEIVEENEP